MRKARGRVLAFCGPLVPLTDANWHVLIRTKNVTCVLSSERVRSPTSACLALAFPSPDHLKLAANLLDLFCLFVWKEEHGLGRTMIFRTM